MKLIRIGIGNPDPTVGAFVTNTDALISHAEQMGRNNCTIGCFAEHSIPGYPVEDLVLWEGFIEGQWNQLLRFAKATAEFDTVYVLGLAVEYKASAYNVAAVVHQGKVLGLVPKEKLPTYGVFYEKRTFAAGIPGFVGAVNGMPFGDLIFSFPFGTLGVEVCEDIWSPDGPMRRRAYCGAETIVNISASPFRSGIKDTRRELISTRASDNLATIVYVNQYGGNDGLAFDGGGFVNQCGRMLYEAPRWKTGWNSVDIDMDRTSRQRRENSTWRTDREDYIRENAPCETIETDRETIVGHPDFLYPLPASGSFFIPEDKPGKNPRDEYFDDLVEAMMLGLDGYFRKTGAFKRIGIALSGGKDSVLTLLVACLYATSKLHMHELQRADFIQCFSMPTRFNSEVTKSISRDVCGKLGVGFQEVPIGAEYEQAIIDVKLMLKPGQELTSIGLQNIQVRIRGKRMWNWSNATGGMWLQTGNMSEKAVGYTTIGGDMMGAYSLIGNLPKTVIIELIKHLNAKHFKMEILDRLIATEASAELAENQADERDLMPFPVLDTCFALFVGEKMMPNEVLKVVDQMFPGRTAQMKEWVLRFVQLFRASIFKWVQCPQSVHLGALDLDRERALQLPVVSSREWLELDKL